MRRISRLPGPASTDAEDFRRSLAQSAADPALVGDDLVAAPWLGLHAPVRPAVARLTGVLEAAVKAVEVVDACLGRLAEAVLARGGALLITADHGNCEVMRDPGTGQPHTAHTTRPVPFIWIQEGAQGPLREGGALEDVAPTVLGLLGLEKPAEMTGRDLRQP